MQSFKLGDFALYGRRCFGPQTADIGHMDAPSLPQELDAVSQGILQASQHGPALDPAPPDLLSKLAADLQDHIRETMRKVLIAMSPSIGVPSEQLLNEFEQLTTPETYRAPIQSRSCQPAGVPPSGSQLQLAFQHDCL